MTKGPDSGITHFQKLCYGMGGLAMNLTNLVISQWILKRYVPNVQAALVPVAVFSVIFMVGRITDAITDPLIGYWSDKLRHPRGRRNPFILYGVLPFAIIYFLLWVPPVDQMHWLNSLYAFIVIQLYFIFYTIVVTPYLALLPEITRDITARVNITTIQAYFVMLGTIVFALIGTLIKEFGWIWPGLLVAALTLVSFLPTPLSIREKATDRSADQGPASLLVWVRLTFKNRPFIYLILSTSFYWFGLNLLIMLVPYWVQDFLGLNEDSVALLMGPFLGMNILFFLVFNILTRKLGKYYMYMLTCLGSALVVPVLTVVGATSLLDGFLAKQTQSIVAMGLIGIPVAGFLILPFAILSDIADYDEQLSGERREGIYFGVQAIFQKSMIGFSILIFGFVVLSGTTSVNLAGLSFLPLLCALSFLAAFVAFWRYPIRDKNGVIALLQN
ncbi:MAG: MFS transporter [Leptospiraceae bacterium]|nr:MFS transporter [Leptospiraceae bacterium]